MDEFEWDGYQLTEIDDTALEISKKVKFRPQRFERHNAQYNPNRASFGSSRLLGKNLRAEPDEISFRPRWQHMTFRFTPKAGRIQNPTTRSSHSLGSFETSAALLNDALGRSAQAATFAHLLERGICSSK
jgi:hypothetical protein